MGWGSEQITGILGSILNTIGDGISDIGEKLRETAKIVTDSEDALEPGQTKTVHSSANKSSYSGTTNKNSYSGTTGKNSYSGTTSKSSYSGTTNKSSYSGNTSKNSYSGNNNKTTYSKFSSASKGNTQTQSKYSTAYGTDTDNPIPNTAKGEDAVLYFGNPCFSTYDQGIRGISFPYKLKINNRRNTPIIITAKFCTMDGDWIHSNVTELSDDYGDVFLKESLFIDEDNYFKESYLFLPYGVIDLPKTQEVCLNLNVFSRKGIGEKILSFTYRFDYFIYENDPREPQFKTKKPNTTQTRSTKVENFSQPGVEELIGLIAHVIKADGITAPEEIRTVIEFFNSAPHLGKDKIKERLKYNLVHLPDIDACCRVLKYNYNTQGLLTFVGLFLNIAASDGRTPFVEIKLIETIAIKLGIPASSFNSLRNSFIPGYRRANNSYSSNIHFGDDDDFGDSSSSYSSTSSDSDYYNSRSDNPLWKMFGLPSTATKVQLKQAYHEKCKLFHPDKFAKAPEAKRKEAEELFKNYQAAYEELLREF